MWKKNVYLLPCLLMVLVMVTACNDITEPVAPMQEHVSFISAISKSRASDTQFDTGDAISVFATTSLSGQLNSTNNYADNRMYSYLNTKFIAQNQGIEIPEDGAKLYYHAIYPYTEAASSRFTFKVLENQSAEISYTNSDLMTAFTESPTGELLVPLKFTHRLSKVVVKIVEGVDLPSGNIALALTNVQGMVEINLNTQTFTTTGSKYNVRMGSNGTKSFKAILPPQDIKSGTQLAEMTVGSKSYNVNLVSELSLQSGTMQTLYLMKSGDVYILGTSETDERLSTIVPPEIQEKMKPYMKIYDGINPPDVQGTFVMEPSEVVYCSDNGYNPGEVMGTEQFIKFSNQNFLKNTLDYEDAEVTLDTYELVSHSQGDGAFISGFGNNFTAYFKVEGTSSGIYIRGAYLISGTKEETGISNCTYAITLIEKGEDPENEIMDAGTIRIFKDGDGMANKANWPLRNERSLAAKSNLLKYLFRKRP